MQNRDEHPHRKTLARSVGEFFGQIWGAVTSDPTRTTREIRRTVETEDRNGLTLRRTIIEEVELRRDTPDHRTP